MTLPPEFQYSQSSLQDYVECQRRFELRYLQRQAWPAVEVEPLLEKEEHLRQGAAFHRLLQQHQLGIPIHEKQLNSDKLRLWWKNFQAHTPQLPAQRAAEITLSANVDGFRILAKYDLIAVESGQQAVIVDWKTAQRLPPRDWLATRLQSRVYPYLLAKAGFNGVRYQPEQIEMIYWFAEFPDQPMRFAYSAEQFQRDEEYLLDLMHGIESQEVFPLTEDMRRCRFCRYRSLCERGRDIGQWDEIGTEDWLESTVTFEAVMELEF